VRECEIAQAMDEVVRILAIPKPIMESVIHF
jgi:hypothetical protein